MIQVRCFLCLVPAKTQCDLCGEFFCEEHGRVGGDRQVQEVGAVAYPSVCTECEEDNSMRTGYA